MRVVIAGSRDITDATLLEEAIRDSGFEITEVFCGLASGVDTLGKIWAENHGLPLRFFPALWKKHGKAAGPIRNQEMAQEADALIAITNGSRGTLNMINAAYSKGLKVFVKEVAK